MKVDVGVLQNLQKKIRHYFIFEEALRGTTPVWINTGDILSFFDPKYQGGYHELSDPFDILDFPGKTYYFRWCCFLSVKEFKGGCWVVVSPTKQVSPKSLENKPHQMTRPCALQGRSINLEAPPKSSIDLDMYVTMQHGGNP